MFFPEALRRVPVVYVYGGGPGCLTCLVIPPSADGPAAARRTQLLCAGCGVGKGHGAPVHARAPQNQLSSEKHICFGRLFCVFWPRQQGAAGRQRQQAAAAGSSQQAAAGSSMQVACSRQQFQPAAVGSCGRQQWAGCGQTLAVRQAASGSSRRHFQAGGSGTRQQQAVAATGSSK